MMAMMVAGNNDDYGDVGGDEDTSDVYSCRLSNLLTDYRKDLCPLTAYRLPQGLNLTAACRLPHLPQPEGMK